MSVGSLTGQNWWVSGGAPWYTDSSSNGSCTVTGVAFAGFGMYWASGNYAWSTKNNRPPNHTKHGAYDYIYQNWIDYNTLACC